MLYYPHLIQVRPEELHGQFRLTRAGLPDLAGWRSETHGPWRLQYSDPLPCIRVLGRRGELVGWFLGHVITETGELLIPGDTFTPPDPSREFGDLVDGLNGRFIAVDLSTAGPSVYLDGQGSLSAVYSEAESSVASTMGLIPHSAATAFAVERILATDVPYSEVRYPLGLTPRHNVERLLPNHVLRLDSWRQERRWPLASFAEHLDPRTVVDLVCQQVPRALRAIRAKYPINLTLTAGRDSRLILACARGSMEGSQLFLADLGDPTSWRDLKVAADIAKRFTLRNVVVRARSGPADLARWVARTGGETGEPRGWPYCRALAEQPAGYATVTGCAADLSKLEGWRSQFLTLPMEPEKLLTYSHAPRTPESLERVERWLAGLPPLFGPRDRRPRPDRGFTSRVGGHHRVRGTGAVSSQALPDDIRRAGPIRSSIAAGVSDREAAASRRDRTGVAGTAGVPLQRYGPDLAAPQRRARPRTDGHGPGRPGQAPLAPVARKGNPPAAESDHRSGAVARPSGTVPRRPTRSSPLRPIGS